jgi:portal protein
LPQDLTGRDLESTEGKDSSVGTKDEKLLKRIRENFAYGSDQWRDIRDEGKKDIRYISGDPWEPAEKEERDDSGRPYLALDELNQYVNQLINDVRQQKRSVKVIPKGSGANDQSAELRGNIIRQIENKSNAQSAYISAFENAAQRSYGFWGIRPQYVSDESFDQELCIKRIPNPDMVLPDPDTKCADGSDMRWCFELDFVPRSQFKVRYPDAEVKDFTPEDIELAPEWVTDRHVLVAGYWEIKITNRTLYQVEGPGGEPMSVYRDELKKGEKPKILNERKVEERQLYKYITNGVEILEENKLPGKWIPIIPVFGKEIYVDRGSGPKRMLFSLIRLARDAYKAYCYAVTCQAECIGKTPKMNYLGVVGQFATNTDWANIHRIPVAYAEYQAKTIATGENILPPPAFTNYEPPIEALLQASESFKRAIQSATGMFNSSVGRHDTAAKSGIAIKALDEQSNQGSYHFVQNFEMSMEHSGRVLNDLLDHYYDTARDVGIRKPDESHETVRINDPENVNVKTGQPEPNIVSGEDAGDHDVTIATGPSFTSQREQANDFVDTMIANIATLPVPPDLGAKILGLAIKLKDVGPLGDEIADMLNPPVDVQGQQQAAAQGHQQLVQATQLAQELTQENQQLKFEKAAKQVDNQFKLEMEKLQLENKLAIAEIQTKAQDAIERATMAMQAWSDAHGAAHEAGMQAQDQQHQQAMAQQQQQAAAQQQQVEAAQNPQQPAGGQ